MEQPFLQRWAGFGFEMPRFAQRHARVALGSWQHDRVRHHPHYSSYYLDRVRKKKAIPPSMYMNY
ncbi:hypothetical protein LX36DRAFT_663477 [Colletotrichum falcatum]|nr:hypothetical protein LX36DRAFT_663477 [Colletotrichum falcatum]